MSVWNGCSTSTRSTYAFSLGQLAKPCSRASSSWASESFAACPARTRSFACLRSCSRFIVRPPSVRARRPRLRAGEKIDRRAVLLRRGGLSPARGPGAPSRAEPTVSEQRGALAFPETSAEPGSARREQPADGARHVRGGVAEVARARLAVRADDGRAPGDAPERLAEVRRAAPDRSGELPLVAVVLAVCRRRHLGLVDVVDLERLQDL